MYRLKCLLQKILSLTHGIRISFGLLDVWIFLLGICDTLYVYFMIILRRFAVPFVAQSIDKDAHDVVAQLDGSSADLTVCAFFFACQGFCLKHTLLLLWFP